jgi:hypothetical protein
MYQGKQCPILTPVSYCNLKWRAMLLIGQKRRCRYVPIAAIEPTYSITSVARARRIGGMVKPKREAPPPLGLIVRTVLVWHVSQK